MGAGWSQWTLRYFASSILIESNITKLDSKIIFLLTAIRKQMRTLTPNWQNLIFFVDGPGTPIPVSALVTSLGVKTDNAFSISFLMH